jgi:hypothetical protein
MGVVQLLMSYKAAAPSGTELLTEANSAALSNEGTSTYTPGSWSNNYNGVIESADISTGLYALKVVKGGSYTNMRLTFTGHTIGDSITFSFQAKTNTTNEQNVILGGTSNNASFMTAGSQPSVYSLYTRTVTLTATTFYIQINVNDAGGVAGDFLLMDALSIIKN